MARGVAKLGFHSRRSAVNKIDRRSPPAKFMQKIIDGLSDELGGALTFRQQMLVQVCADMAMRLQLAMGKVVNDVGDAREVDRHVILLANSLRKTLAALDIAALPDPGPSLAEYLSAKQAERVG